MLVGCKFNSTRIPSLPIWIIILMLLLYVEQVVDVESREWMYMEYFDSDAPKLLGPHILLPYVLNTCSFCPLDIHLRHASSCICGVGICMHLNSTLFLNLLLIVRSMTFGPNLFWYHIKQSNQYTKTPKLG